MKGFKLTSTDTQIILQAATLQKLCSATAAVTVLSLDHSKNACADSISPSVHKLTNFSCYWQVTRYCTTESNTKQQPSLTDHVVIFSSSTGLQDSVVLHQTVGRLKQNPMAPTISYTPNLMDW